ncbi:MULTISPECIES: addiction module protein [unclassified Anabaena]|uniref:addiction module protein n=1 Tax=unclassified Anabaena TaxID=2619674 RepID=UPI001445B6A7|nr:MULTISPECIES: addiction module protein [unclassified Anabaena]MTJ08550.1 addiction module protein [Anabaena sp. UHCC 0204]MTJ53800.1 addiction module protein [Anabaena sp. UHCC 0253]
MANVTYDEIFGAVLTLPPLYRAMLAEHLLKSLDEINPQVEAAWETEIANRIQAIDEDQVASIPADEVLQRLKNRLATQLLQWLEVKINKEPQSIPNKRLRQPGLGLDSCIFDDNFDDPLPDEFWLRSSSN